MKKKILIILLLTFCIFLKSEVTTSFNEKLYNDVDDWMYDDFLKENRISGVYYENENWNKDVDSYYEKDIEFPDAPKKRSFVISSVEEYNNILKKSEITINFNLQILILCTLSTSSSRPFYIKGINLEENILYIKIAQRPDYSCKNTGAMPGQAWVLIVIDNVEFSDVEFEITK